MNTNKLPNSFDLNKAIKESVEKVELKKEELPKAERQLKKAYPSIY